MQTISVFDIAAGHWYQQQASGEVPSWRAWGCSVVASAPDKSSHSIYVFGGWGETSTDLNDGYVYVLSIPSFTFIRVTSDTDQRSRHQCHLMGKNHMLVVGGMPPGNEPPWPAGPPDISACDTSSKFSQGLGIFSLNHHTWATTYDPEVGAQPYQIHSSISNIIGGNATGGATKRNPIDGFSGNALRKLLQTEIPVINASAPPDPTASPTSLPDLQPSSGLGTGAIAGIVVGAISLIILSIGFFFFRRHRRGHGTRPPSVSGIDTAPEIIVMQPPTELCPGMAAPEMRAGDREDSLARMYQSHEMSDESQRYEMASRPRTIPAMPSLSRIHELPG
ncbi:MAG: hypothetical protein Q9219_000466 [cf. Caloplaca sp. 3 TL-2023]